MHRWPVSSRMVITAHGAGLGAAGLLRLDCAQKSARRIFEERAISCDEYGVLMAGRRRDDPIRRIAVKVTWQARARHDDLRREWNHVQPGAPDGLGHPFQAIDPELKPPLGLQHGDLPDRNGRYRQGGSGRCSLDRFAGRTSQPLRTAVHEPDPHVRVKYVQIY